MLSTAVQAQCERGQLFVKCPKPADTQLLVSNYPFCCRYPYADVLLITMPLIHALKWETCKRQWVMLGNGVNSYVSRPVEHKEEGCLAAHNPISSECA